MMNRRNYSLFLLLAASVVMSLPYMPYYNPLSCDTETYRYISFVMMKGGVPYRDVFDHKPPMIYALNYTGLFLGGWLQWLINTFLAALATFLLYRLGRKHRCPYPAIPPLLFNLMLHDFLIIGTGGVTREYASMVLVIFFCVMMGEGRWRYYVMGLLASFTFFLQQEQVLAFLPFLVYSFFRRGDGVLPGRRIMEFVAGGLLVLAPILLYFGWHHALADLWRDAFGFNFGWYTTTLRETFGEHLKRAKRVLDAGNYEVAVLVVLVLGIVSLLSRHGNKRLLLASLAAVPLSIIPAFMGGRGVLGDFYDYYLPLSASVSILLFTVFAYTEEPFLQAGKLQVLFGILACTSLAYTFLQHITHLSPKRAHPVVDSPELNYLRAHRPGNYQLYQFGDHRYVCAYNEFRILAPSRWIYHNFWTVYDNWDRDHAILRSIEEDLLRHRTTYVIDCSTDPATQFKEPVLGLWHSFLEKYYERVPLPDTGGVRLWKWRGRGE